MKESGGTQAVRPRRAAAALACGLVLGSLLLLLTVGAGPLDEMRLRRMDEPALRAWTDRNPLDARGYFYLGLARERAGNGRDALDEYSTALRWNPRLSRARAREAALLAESGKGEAAEILVREGLDLDPSAPDLHRALGSILDRKGNAPAAAAEWEVAAAGATRDAGAWHRLGLCRLALRDEERALAAARRAVDLAPRSALYRQSLARVLRLKGDYAQAARECREAVRLSPGQAAGHLELGKLLHDRDGPTAEAEASLTRAVDLGPDDPLARSTLATLQEERGELGLAAAGYRAALRLLPLRRPPAEQFGTELWEAWSGQVEAAEFGLARILPRIGRSNEAGGHLERFRRASEYRNHVHRLLVQVASRPGQPALREELGRIYTAAGLTRRAQEEYRLAGELRMPRQHASR